MREQIAKKYIKGLFQAVKSSEMDPFLSQLNEIKKGFTSQKFIEIVTSPYVNRQKKEEFLLSLIDKKSDIRLINFLKLLVQNGRIELIPDICREIENAIAISKNRYNGHVICSEKLSTEMMDALSKGISKKVNAEISLEQVSSDNDGIILRVDELGIEVGFSKERLKSSLTEHILKAI